MRRQIPIILLFAAALCLACSKDLMQDSAGVYSLELSMPSEFTKTHLGAKSAGSYPVYWSEGDVISVNGVLSRPLSASQAGRSSAVFSFESALSTPYNIRYGRDVPAFQEYSEGNIRNGYAPMAASGLQSSVMLRHLSCIVSVPLVGDEVIAGLSLGALDQSLVSEGPTVEMTVPDGGVDISGGKIFCFALRPGAYAKGLVLTVYAASGACMRIAYPDSIVLEAGKVYELPTSNFESNAEPVTAIADYAGLKAFSERVAASEKYLQARLTADIEVDSAWQPLEGFSGDFDGGGYTVSGLRKAFANELVGCIRNLTVEGNIQIDGAEDIVGSNSVYWAGILANRIYTYGMVANCVAKGSISYTQWGGKELEVGGICGYAPRGTISHCINKASVTASGNGSNSVFAAGIVARVYSGAETIDVRDCRNEGVVSVRGSLKTAAVGGIVGRMDAPHTSVLKGNENEGRIEVVPSASVNGALYMGGIVGYCLDEIQSCSNTGAIYQGAPAGSNNLQIGGIAGYIVAGRVAGCGNGGTILCDGPSAGNVRCGGIIGHAAGDSSVSSIEVSDCHFWGDITLDISKHGTQYAKAVTGFYSITNYSETDCTDMGRISAK